MSMLRWFSRKPDAEAAPTSNLRDSTRPPAADSRKSERSARRERLYAVVRQSMANAGVLSSSYRFKVLSLDGRGRQFLVMVDLVGAPGGDTADLGRIEAAMQLAAKKQHDIVVKAVYWREAAATGGQRASAPGGTQPRSASGGQQRAAAPAPEAAPEAPASAPGDADPLMAEEIAAFRHALATGSERPAARAPQNYTLLTGFEDTEIRAPGLSNSQHGDLR